MAKPAPRDRQYAGTLSRTFNNLAADADLTAQTSATAEWPQTAATEIWISVPVAFAGGSFVYRMQGDPSVDVTFPVPQMGVQAQGGGGMVIGPLRGAFVAIDETTTDGLTILAIWQGGT